MHARYRAFGLYAAFFLSGSAGLACEVVWMRMLTPVFGVTVYALGTVLAAFMLGLAIGSAAFGRLADRLRRPVLLYILLELGVGAYAVAFPSVLRSVESMFIWLHAWTTPGPAATAVARLTICLLALLPPTVLMGGTLPTLARYVAALRKEVGRPAGYLYGLNTFGAVLGAMAAGFVLIAWLGVRGTNWAAAALSLAAALLAAPSASADAGPPVGRRVPGATESAPFRLLALFAVAGSGIAALSYEVVWTRLVALMVNATVYSFAGVLAVLLVGLAAGSVLSSRFLVRRAAPLLAFALIEAGIGLYALLSVPLFGLAAATFADVRAATDQFGGSFFLYMSAQLGLMLAVIVVPTLLMGAAFPLACRLAAGDARTAGSAVGAVGAWNTLGAAAGSAAAAFLLVPLIGLKGCLLAAAGVNLVLFALLLRRVPAGPRLASAVVVAFLLLGALFTAGQDITFRSRAENELQQIVSHYEGPEGVVEVFRSVPEGALSIKSNRLNQEGSNDPMGLHMQRLQVYLPLMLHPSPREVLALGMGTGNSFAAALADGRVRRADVVEISPGVIEAARLYFSGDNLGAADPPKGKLFRDDARNFVLLHADRYDLIAAELFFPWSPGVGSLYTVEHYSRCREHLKPRGLLCQWVPLHQVGPRELAAIIRSFSAAFPHVSAWVYWKHLALIGSEQPLSIDLPRFLAAFESPGAKADMARHELDDPAQMLAGYLMRDEAVRAFAGSGPLNTDDHPLIEFRAPRTFAHMPGDDLFLANRRRLDAAREPVGAVIRGPSDAVRTLDADVAACLAARGHFLTACESLARNRPSDAVPAGDALRASLQAYPRFFPARVMLGILYMNMSRLFLRQDDIALAVQAAEVAAEFYPRPAVAYATLGWLLDLWSHHRLARTWYERAIELDPMNHAAREALSRPPGRMP